MARAGSVGGTGNAQAHQSMRVNLASVIFPFTKELWGRSIVVPQFDQNYERQLVSSADIGKDKGVPMSCYLHNCMPTTEGYQSIGFTTNVAGDGVTTDFDRVMPLIYTTPNDAHFMFSPSSGKNYIFDATRGPTWLSTSPLAPGTASANTLVTTAYVQGITYIFYAGIGCFTYDQVGKVLVPVTLVGLTTSQILGITTAFGYLIAFSATAIAWSSVTTPTDFTPSLITGAGGGNVSDVKGNIVICVPVSGGFLVFCEKNVVGAKYTGNVRFPFIFKEVPASGGINSQDQISVGDNVGQTYAWTSAGLQDFTISTCENVFPDASDFLAKLIYEDFNETTLIWTEFSLGAPLNVKLAVTGNRFLIISYGVTPGMFTYAVIYDSALKRWGKIKINHTAAFQWNVPNLFGAVTYGQLGAIGLTYGQLAAITYGQLLTSANTPELPFKTLAFLQQDGTVQTVVFDLQGGNTSGVLMLGKFQFERNKFITHQWTDVENVLATDTFTMYVVLTLDGKTMISPIPATKIRTGQDIQRWAARLTGQNYSLLFKGAFNMVSAVTDFVLGGDR